MTIFEVHCVLDTSLDAGDMVISKANESLPAKGLNYSLGEVPVKNVISSSHNVCEGNRPG